MRILLALNEMADIQMLEAALLSLGHECVAVRRGDEVLPAMGGNPDMVMMDANLAEVSGYECCRLIKHDEKFRHKPVVMLMPKQDATGWARFAECGADDFIELPLVAHVVKAKVKLLSHLGDLHHRLDSSRRHMAQEIRLAKHLFDTITKRQPKDIEFLHFWGLSAGHFCGDLFIYERTPDNHLHVMLGDFTGHGLAAAMGALPVSDIFFAMTRNGCGLQQIIEEANAKLYEIMPSGKFCAAIFLRLSADYTTLDIWNGGMPQVLLLDRRNRPVEKYESHHLPLGVADLSSFDARLNQYNLSGVQSVVLYSDGLIEAENSLGEFYGEPRLERLIASEVREHNLFNKIKSSILSFLEGLEPHDDVSLAVIRIM